MVVVVVEKLLLCGEKMKGLPAGLYMSNFQSPQLFFFPLIIQCVLENSPHIVMRIDADMHVPMQVVRVACSPNEEGVSRVAGGSVTGRKMS